MSRMHRTRDRVLTVLPDKEYGECLDGIIQRDYYPELRRLEYELSSEDVTVTPSSVGGVTPCSLTVFGARTTSEQAVQLKKLLENNNKRSVPTMNTLFYAPQSPNQEVMMMPPPAPRSRRSVPRDSSQGSNDGSILSLARGIIPESTRFPVTPRQRERKQSDMGANEEWDVESTMTSESSVLMTDDDASTDLDEDYDDSSKNLQMDKLRARLRKAKEREQLLGQSQATTSEERANCTLPLLTDTSKLLAPSFQIKEVGSDKAASKARRVLNARLKRVKHASRPVSKRTKSRQETQSLHSSASFGAALRASYLKEKRKRIKGAY